MKIISDKTSGAVLGASIVGAGACELIHVFSALIYKKGTVSDLENIVFAHPTLAEIIGDAVL